MKQKLIKSQILILTLGMFLSSKLYAEQSNTIAAIVHLNQSNPVILEKLDYKHVFMKFHQKDLRFLKMKDLTDQAIGLQNAEGDIQYAVFNPVISYKNLQGEKRFIVYIEKFDQEDGEINSGHPARPQVELYLFKRLKTGQYQLLSQIRPDTDISGSWGVSHLNASSFVNMQQIGKNQLGFTYSGGYTSTGTVSEDNFLIVLNESGWIEQYYFGGSSDNSGIYNTDDPKYSGSSKDYKILKDANAQSLYPIQVTYSQFGHRDWQDDFPKNGTKEILKFNQKKNCYIHKNGMCN